MKLKMLSKKWFLILISMVVVVIMVSPAFTQVLGKNKDNTSESEAKKDTIGYVETQGELVKYNNDGVQITHVTDLAERDEILTRVQRDPDFTMLLQEVARYDAEETGRIDIELVSLQLHSADPITVKVSFDNGNLDPQMTGSSRNTVEIEMVSLSLRSINDNDVHLTVAYGEHEDEKIVAGMVTNNYGAIDADGLEHQVYYIHSILIVKHYPVYWYIWWYDSHHHPNWFYGWYYWYWKYYYYYHYDWYPWYTWWWGGWYYWHYWGYWSTYWPYYYYKPIY
ncbi:MAG: hypothetical protein JSV49_11820 [Thermoplasmata archaeon]|nr:MAG: hypothetical protein JSV49_11820 [Thermoplasmata archaeon]